MLNIHASFGGADFYPIIESYSPTMRKHAVFRKDIQALRAISALTIMICHIWLNRVSGGVDVFFVISGYFMAATLFKLEHQKWYQRYAIFWQKILIKIFPTSLLIILSTTLVAYLTSYPFRGEIIRSGVFSLLQLENINLILQKSNYLLSNTKSIFQHFWALSIQLQFYLFYPFIFMIFKKNQIIILSIITLLSFFFSLYLVSVDPDLAYYHPLTRLWEFTSGGIVFLLYQRNIHIKHGSISAVAFLGFILFAFLYPKQFNFPGWSSLTPVICATLILLNTGKNVLLSLLSNNPFFVLISKFSFTLYLVHWPILILTKYLTFKSTVNIKHGIYIMLSSIATSYFIHHIFERKINKILNTLSLVHFFRIIIFLMTSCLLMYTALYFENKYREHQATILYKNNLIRLNSLNNNILALKVLGTSSKSRNQCMSYSAELKTCIWGDSSASKAIAIVGGSHIEQWLPIFDHFGKKHHFKVIQINKGDCPLGGAEHSDYNCQIWSKKVIHYLVTQKQIQYIITNSTRSYEKDHVENVPLSYSSALVQLKKHSHAKIIGIRDNARFEINPNQCLTNKLIDNDQCSYNIHHYLSHTDPSLHYQHILTPLDLSTLYCQHPKKCSLHHVNIPIFADSNHLSMIYVEMMADQGSQLLENAILKKPI